MTNLENAQKQLDKINLMIKDAGGVMGCPQFETVCLDEKKGQALVLAKDCIAQIPYDLPGGTAVTWSICTVRKWLNDEFYESMPDAVKEKIVLTKLETKDNCSIPGGEDTEDHIFLLSIEDYGKLPENMRTAALDGKPCWWWLRSPGYSATDVANVMANGVLDGGLKGHGFYSHCDCGGIRPAMVVNVSE